MKRRGEIVFQYLLRRVRRLLRQRRVRVSLYGLAAGLGFALSYRKGVVLAFYLLASIPTNSLIMIPNEPIAIATIQLLRTTYGLVDAALLVASMGVIGGGVACVIDQTILRWVAERDRVATWLNQPMTERSLRWFRVWPFGTIMLFAFLPLPYLIVRFAAAATRYPVERYTAATMLGKFPRLFVLGLASGVWVFPPWVAAAILLLAPGFMIFTRFRAMRAGHSGGD